MGKMYRIQWVDGGVVTKRYFVEAECVEDAAASAAFRLGHGRLQVELWDDVDESEGGEQ